MIVWLIPNWMWTKRVKKRDWRTQKKRKKKTRRKVHSSVPRVRKAHYEMHRCPLFSKSFVLLSFILFCVERKEDEVAEQVLLYLTIKIRVMRNQHPSSTCNTLMKRNVRFQGWSCNFSMDRKICTLWEWSCGGKSVSVYLGFLLTQVNFRSIFVWLCVRVVHCSKRSPCWHFNIG